jgi:hypothetical protein
MCKVAYSSTLIQSRVKTANVTDGYSINVNLQPIIVIIIDLVLIDPQSVGKRTHDLMDTVNAKKRWKTICWRANKYLK